MIFFLVQYLKICDNVLKTLIKGNIMGIVVPIKKFQKPVRPHKRYVPKGIRGAATRKNVGTSKFRVHINKDKYIKLYHKAKVECNTSAPVHDVLELLVQYFVENEFLIHRRIYPADSIHAKNVKEKKINSLMLMPEEEDNPITVWMRISRYSGKMLETKQKTEGVSKSYILNILIDFYLSKQFYIKTKIIRTNRYLKDSK